MSTMQPVALARELSSPEGLGKAIATGTTEAVRLYKAVKPRLPLERMDEVQGGIIGQIFGSAIHEGELKVDEVYMDLTRLRRMGQLELKPELLDGLESLAEGLRELQEVQSTLKDCRGRYEAAVKLTVAFLGLSDQGIRLEGIGGALVPWRLLTEGRVLALLTEMAARGVELGIAFSLDPELGRAPIVKALQLNERDAHIIISALAKERLGNRLSLIR